MYTDKSHKAKKITNIVNNYETPKSNQNVAILIINLKNDMLKQFSYNNPNGKNQRNN